jgi:hypothetical protein
VHRLKNIEKRIRDGGREGREKRGRGREGRDKRGWFNNMSNSTTAVTVNLRAGGIAVLFCQSCLLDAF